MNERIEALLERIEAPGEPRTMAELAKELNLPARELQEALDALMHEGKVAVTKKGRCAPPERLGLTAARAAFQHNGGAIARPLDGGETMKIEPSRLRPMPDDLLLVRPTGERCTIETICARGRQTIAAQVRVERGERRGFPRTRATATPCDPRVPYEIVLDGDLSFIRNNELALIAIDTYPEANRPIFGHPERVLGPAGSMRARMRATAEDGGFPTEFSEAAESLANELRRTPMPEPGEQRQDLRALTLFTIDGADAKDFDDAVSIEPLPNGWRLGVHIADVSHYVRPGSAIDREAYQRGTSLYLPGLTVPMLPEALSNDLCSLMPDVDRLTMSLFMDVTPRGQVTDHRLTRAIIRSKARLTYARVNRLFEDGEELENPEINAALLEMRTLARTLRDRRGERGAVDLDLPEAQFALNERGEPDDILCPERGEAERLIEEFMLIANETVARLARDTQTPFAYRVHERPDPDRIHQLEDTLDLAGTHVRLGDHPHPGALRRMLEESAESESIDLIRRCTLRALKRARYADQPLGHYALSLTDYCHFTSPIRRYPDLTVHRMLKLLLDGGAAEYPHWEKRMPELTADCSLREQAAVKAERAADDIMKAAWMSHQLGRKFWGIVSGVTNWGLYVTLPNTVEGLVHISDIGEYFNYDADRQLLVGEVSGAVYRLGMKVRVRAISASVERGEINFELAFSPRKSYNE